MALQVKLKGITIKEDGCQQNCTAPCWWLTDQIGRGTKWWTETHTSIHVSDCSSL